MNIQPRNDFVLIERIDEKPKGLILRPETANEKSIHGKVIAVGPGKMVEGVNGNMVRRPLEVKPGDRVLFNSRWSEFSSTHEHKDTAFRYEDRLHLVMEADIYCKLDT